VIVENVPARPWSQGPNPLFHRIRDGSTKRALLFFFPLSTLCFLDFAGSISSAEAKGNSLFCHGKAGEATRTVFSHLD